MRNYEISIFSRHFRFLVKQIDRCYILGSHKPLIGNLVRQILIIFSIIISFTFISCAKKSSTSSSTSDTNTELEGTWTTNCNSTGTDYYEIKTLIVSGTDFSLKYEAYTDSSCSTDSSISISTFSSLSIGDSVTFSSGSTGHKFSVTVSSFTLTPTSASIVSALNTDGWCGYSNWAINTAKNITGKTCGSASIDVANTTYLGLYMLVGNNLFIGDWRSDGNYPTSVYTSIPLVKQ